MAANVSGISGAGVPQAKDVNHWVVSQEKLQFVANVLIKGYAHLNAASQSKLQKNLDQLSSEPEFLMYLVHLASNGKEVAEKLRVTALLVLKTYIARKFAQLPISWRQQLVHALFSLARHPTASMRSSVATCLSAVLPHPPAWPNLLQGLLKMVRSESELEAEMAFWALHRICEDHCTLLANCEPGPNHPFATIVPKFIEVFRHPKAQYRQIALATINVLMNDAMGMMLPYMDLLLKHLFSLGNDPSLEVRTELAIALGSVVEALPTQILPVCGDAFRWMVVSCASDHEELAMAACEFWPLMASHHRYAAFREQLVPLLPKLLPLLLQRMKMSDEEAESLMSNPYDDPATPDRDQDIRQLVQSTRACAGLSGESGNADESEELKDGSDVGSVRNNAARALDHLSSFLGPIIMPHIFPNICASLAADQPWQVQEAAILALGAIQNGSSACLIESRVSILGFLLKLMTHEHKLVRVVACWTMSRFSLWILEHDELRDEFLKPIVLGFMNRMADPFKCVRSAAVSGFSHLATRCSYMMEDWLDEMVPHMVKCLLQYQKKNRILMYDAFDRILGGASEKMKQPALVKLYVPVLLARWEALKDDDYELAFLMQAISTMVSVLGLQLQNVTKPIVNRCMIMWERALVEEQNNNGVPTDAMMYTPQAIDLIGGFAEGFEDSFSMVVANTKINLLLFETLRRPHSNDIFQSALALVGDTARYAPLVLKDAVPQLLPVLLPFLRVEKPAAVANNSAWALGEIMNKQGELFVPIANDLIDLLIAQLTRPEEIISLKQQCCLLLGRLALSALEPVAAKLGLFVRRWCELMSFFNDSEEKVSAFAGFSLAVKANPKSAFDDFAYVCAAIASWDPDNLPKALLQSQAEVFAIFRQGVGIEQWNAFLNNEHFDPTVRDHIRTVYKV